MTVDTTGLRKLLAEAIEQATTDHCFPWAFVPEADTEWGNVRCGCEITIFRTHRVDAALIVAAVNALPELLDELDRMRPYAMRGGYGADEESLSDC